MEMKRIVFLHVFLWCWYMQVKIIMEQ